MNEKKSIQTDSKKFLHFLFLFFPLNKSLHKSKTQRRPKNALGVIAVVDDMGLWSFSWCRVHQWPLDALVFCLFSRTRDRFYRCLLNLQQMGISSDKIELIQLLKKHLSAVSQYVLCIWHFVDCTPKYAFCYTVTIIVIWFSSVLYSLCYSCWC